MKTIGDRFKQVREMLGISQTKLARILGLKQGFLSNIETSYRNPDEQTLRLLEKELGISKKWLTTGEGLVFVDSKKALEILRKKEKFSTEEMLYIFHEIQNAYSTFENYFIKKEFTNQIIEFLQRFSLCDASDFERSIKMSKLVAHIINYLIVNKFSLNEDFYNELQKLIKNWFIYVFTANVMYKKYEYIPLENIYVDPEILKNLNKVEELKQITKGVVVEAEKVKISNFSDRFILDFTDKGYIKFEKERLFGFISVVLNIRNDETKKVLDYEIFYTEYEKVASIKQKDISLTLTLEEFQYLKTCSKKLKEDEAMWSWLQKSYIEKYGFV